MLAPHILHLYLFPNFCVFFSRFFFLVTLLFFALQVLWTHSISLFFFASSRSCITWSYSIDVSPPSSISICACAKVVWFPFFSFCRCLRALCGERHLVVIYGGRNVLGRRRDTAYTQNRSFFLKNSASSRRDVSKGHGRRRTLCTGEPSAFTRNETCPS